MNKVYPKLYIGPMTRNVIDTVIEFNEQEPEKPIGFIASKRQIDFDGGYVWDTVNFVDYVKQRNPSVIIERDHSGPGQGAFRSARNMCPIWHDMVSMKIDAESKMDIIHLDPWKVCKQNFKEGILQTARDIIYVCAFNDKILFEVGTEEAIQPFTPEQFELFLDGLLHELGTELFKRIKYAVIQSGTRIDGTTNVGNFDPDRLIKMNKVCKDFNLLSKEHNGDYLSNYYISERFKIGLDAINIAPELGVIETKFIMDNFIKGDNTAEEHIFKLCYDGEKWKNWFADTKDLTSTLLINSCGHYHNSYIRSFLGLGEADNNLIKEHLKLCLLNLTKPIYK